MQSNEYVTEFGDDKQLHHESIDRRVRRDRVFLNNPVIMQGIGLAPLIVASNTATNALLLSVAVIALLTPTRFIAAILCTAVPARFRGPIYVISAAIMYIPMFYIVSAFFDIAQISQVGLYLPLLVTDPIIIKRYVTISNESMGKAISKGVITTVGYVLVMLLMGVLREFLGMGSVFGFVLLDTAPFPIASLPTGGFILLAVIMMFWRSGVNVIKNAMIRAREERTQL